MNRRERALCLVNLRSDALLVLGAQRLEEFSRLKLALLEHKREVLLGLRRSGTVDDLVVRRISANLDLEQVRLQGIEALE